jgi:hypothetical protein
VSADAFQRGGSRFMRGRTAAPTAFKAKFTLAMVMS